MSIIINQTSYSDTDFSFSRPTDFLVSANPLHMQLRATPEDNTVWLEATRDNGLISIVNPGISGETVKIYVPVPNLLKLVAGDYDYSLIMSSVGGTKRTELFRGVWTHIIGPTTWPAGTL